MKEEYKDCVNLLQYSETSERAWHLVHTVHGPLLLGLWYRPPDLGEVGSVETLAEEWAELEQGAVGSLLVGDLNVHHKGWLVHSRENTPEGRALYSFC